MAENDQSRDRNFNDADQIRHRLHAEHVVKPKHKWAVRHKRLNPSRVCIFSSLSQKTPSTSRASVGIPKGFRLPARRWHRLTWENEKDQDRAGVPSRCKRPQKRRMIPPLATTLCWVLERNAAFRFGLPEKKSRTSPRKLIKRNNR